jgi:hypothetical protein
VLRRHSGLLWPSGSSEWKRAAFFFKLSSGSADLMHMNFMS